MTLLPPGCLVVVGMAAEARLLPDGSSVACTGADPARLITLLEALRPRALAVLSFGIAGGLEPGLPSGALLSATRVVEAGAGFDADPAWCSAIAAATGARPAILAASHEVVGSVGAKRALHARTGAAAVDMESGAAARFARAHGLPFAALRAVADPAEHVLPPSAAIGLNPDGTPAPGRVLAALLRRPQDLPGLIRIAWQSRRALGALALAVRRGGP